MESAFDSLMQQTRERMAGVTPYLESYIVVRRGTSGCFPCFVLIECDHRPFHV